MTTTQDDLPEAEAATRGRTDGGPRPFPGRRGHPPQLREQAARLRREGVARADIARQLGVGFSTIARWFREDGVAAVNAGSGPPRGPGSRFRATIDERWAHQNGEQDMFRGAVGDLTQREVLLVGATLYWAEGTKSKPWRRNHIVKFINSDPDVITVFLAFLAASGVDRDRLHCRLSIHESADVVRATTYWKDVVGQDVRFLRPTLKRHTPRTLRRNVGPEYHGCLVVHVLDSASVYRSIAGTWQGIAGGVDVAPPSPVV